jgi:ferritin-like metal-binding protein YciE
MKDEIIDWLRDAYAMERSQEGALEKIHGNSDESIACRTSAAMHLTETRQHARIVESLLRSLGADISSFKTGLGVMAEKVKGMTTTLSHDEQIKDLLASYAMESFEIACYSAIVTAAEIANLSQVANACRQIILDEEKMAEIIRKDGVSQLQRFGRKHEYIRACSCYDLNKISLFFHAARSLSCVSHEGDHLE